MMQLLRYVKPYRIFIACVLLLIFLRSLSDLYLPTLMADIVDTGVIKGDLPYILKIGSFMLLVAAGGAVSSIIASFLSSRVAAGFGKTVRGKVFTHAEHFSLHEFDTIGTASLITRTTNDITQVQQVLVMMMRMMIMAPMMCIGGVLMAISKDAKLSLVIVLSIPIVVASIVITLKRGLPLFRIMQVKLDALNRVMREGLTGIRVIRAFNRVEHEQKRFDQANLDLTSTAIKVNKIMASMMPVTSLILNFSMIAIVWFGGFRIDQGHIQVGDLMAFIQYAMQIMFALVMVSMMFVMIPRAAASAVRINEVLETNPAIQDPEVPVTKASVPTHGSDGTVVFKNVTFRYPGAEKPALEMISFTARPGQVTAIIGGTGSGKSTILSLITRFYDVEKECGSIVIDDVDIRDMTQAVLRSKIGLIPQKAVLFTGSISDNIRYGKEDATEQEIQLAADIAQASEFIQNMQDGFDSILAQGGTNLSGGQKQRLAIARALVRRPEIYLFDDSFSALDFKTDARLRAALKAETANSTLVIVAQRVSTILDADQIIVLDEGTIAGIGTHHQLMHNCAVYREIVHSQLSEEEIA